MGKSWSSRVIGRCWACHQPCTGANSTLIYDPSVGYDRRVHKGECHANAERLIGPAK